MPTNTLFDGTPFDRLPFDRLPLGNSTLLSTRLLRALPSHALSCDLLRLRLMTSLLGTTAGFAPRCIRARLLRSGGLRLLLGLLLVALDCLPLGLLWFLGARALESRRRCADAQRQRGADHGRQDGTVDGGSDVHGGALGIASDKRRLFEAHYTCKALNTI